MNTNKTKVEKEEINDYFIKIGNEIEKVILKIKVETFLKNSEIKNG